MHEQKSAYYQGLTVATRDYVEVADPKIDTIVAEVDENQLYLLDTLDPKIDQIDKVVDENQLYLQFIACRYEEQVKFLGNGCDGIDNDCDSVIVAEIGDGSPNVQVDECDEDQIPPTITLAREIPATFLSLDEAKEWFEKNVIASDDCVPSDRLVMEITGQESEGVGTITVQVDDNRCFNEASRKLTIDGNVVSINGPGEPSTTETFTIFIDGTAPQVTCGFNKPQDANFDGGDDTLLFIDRYNERRDIVNVQFFYNIEVRTWHSW